MFVHTYRSGRVYIAIIVMIGLCILAFVWTFLANLPTGKKLSEEDFRTTCDENGYEVTELIGSTRATCALQAQKDGVSLFFYVYTTEEEAVERVDWFREDTKKWREGIPVRWGEREKFAYAKWGSYTIWSRNGNTVVWGYYELRNAKKNDSELKRIFRKLGY